MINQLSGVLLSHLRGAVQRGITQSAAYFQSLGIDANEAREGLTSMLNFAYGVH